MKTPIYFSGIFHRSYEWMPHQVPSNLPYPLVLWKSVSSLFNLKTDPKMKALKLSSIALCLFALVSSCTKDTVQTSTASSSSLESVLGSSRNGGAEVQPTDPGTGNGSGQGNGGQAGGGTGVGNVGTNGGGNTAVDPSLTITYDPEIGIKGEPVTVTGTFDATTGVAVPDCGKLQIMQLIGTQYVGVGSQVNVTTDNHKVTYTFTPTEVGDAAYSFKVHYVAAGCDGFSETKSNAFPLKVVEPCLPLALKGELTKHTSLGNNKYEFEVTYTVTSCPAMGAAKLQGGLTAKTGFLELKGLESSDSKAVGEERKETNNSNHIIMWNFNIGKGYSNTFKVTFTKELNGSAPYELTGQWSVSTKNPETGEEVKAYAPSIVFPG